MSSGQRAQPAQPGSRLHPRGAVTGALVVMLAVLAAGTVSQGLSGRLAVSVRWPTRTASQASVPDAGDESGQVVTQTLRLTEPVLTSGYSAGPQPAPTLQLVQSFAQREGTYTVARGTLSNGAQRAAVNLRLVVTFRDAAGRVVDSDRLAIDQVSPGTQREWALGVGYRPAISLADVRLEWDWGATVVNDAP